MSFLLDTNVISEAMKKAPEPAVLSWLDVNYDRCWLSSIAIAEVELGIELLPPGRRRDALNEAFGRLVTGLQGRTVDFDARVAHRWAVLSAELERRGRKTPILDSQIEATALQWRLTIATRNASDFVQARTINPWQMAR